MEKMRSKVTSRMFKQANICGIIVHKMKQIALDRLPYTANT